MATTSNPHLDDWCLAETAARHAEQQLRLRRQARPSQRMPFHSLHAALLRERADDLLAHVVYRLHMSEREQRGRTVVHW